MNSSSSFGPERDADRANGYDSDGLFNGTAANSAAHHSNHGLAGDPLHHIVQHPKSGSRLQSLRVQGDVWREATCGCPRLQQLAMQYLLFWPTSISGPLRVSPVRCATPYRPRKFILRNESHEKCD